MLPEILGDAVAFLPLCDLDSVLYANRQLSTVVSKCVKVIRVWQFEFVHIFVDENSMILNELAMYDGGDDGGRCARVTVNGRENMSTLLDIALHNACFKVLTFVVSPDAVIPLPNTSALMVKKLELSVRGAPSPDSLVDVTARFRKVQVVSLYECEAITDFSPVVELCRQKGIRRVTHNYEDLMDWR